MLFDSIGDVGVLPDKRLENVPSNLDPQICKLASGFYRLKGELLVVLGVDKVLSC